MPKNASVAEGDDVTLRCSIKNKKGSTLFTTYTLQNTH